MPASLSVDLRQRILAAYDAKEGSRAAIGRALQGELIFDQRSETTQPVKRVQ